MADELDSTSRKRLPEIANSLLLYLVAMSPHEIQDQKLVVIHLRYIQAILRLMMNDKEISVPYIGILKDDQCDNADRLKVASVLNALNFHILADELQKMSPEHLIQHYTDISILLQQLDGDKTNKDSISCCNGWKELFSILSGYLSQRMKSFTWALYTLSMLQIIQNQ